MFSPDGKNKSKLNEELNININNYDTDNVEEYKYKIQLRYLNDLKFLNFLFVEFLLFQMIFWGIFSLFSLFILPFQLIIFFKLHSILKNFPLFEESEIDFLSTETKRLENISQFTILLNIFDFGLLYFEIIMPFGKKKFEFDVYEIKNKFLLIEFVITGLKIFIIYLMKMKIQRINIRSEMINI